MAEVFFAEAITVRSGPPLGGRSDGFSKIKSTTKRGGMSIRLFALATGHA